jgi:nicotinamidase/pyrazinamidase
MAENIAQFKSGDLLLVIDVQKDFCPGGALAIAGGDEVVPVLNTWLAAARDNGVPRYLSRDWHPKHHPSFTESGGKWPPHCIQDTDGARFHADLEVPHDAVIVTKGTRFDQDQNSAFDQTGLADWLHQQKIKRIFVGGLAQDVCVLATVLDGQNAGFDMQLIANATRPVNTDDGRSAIEKMRRAGAEILEIMFS